MAKESPTSLDLMELKERFTHQPLIPDNLAKQQSTWRQRWGLPPRQVYAASTDWRYYIDPAEVIHQSEPNDPRRRLRFALLHETRPDCKYFLTGTKGAGKSTTAYSLWNDDAITERFCLLGCSVADYLNLADLDASQVIAVMTAHLVEAIRDAKPEADLQVSEAKVAIKALEAELKKHRPSAEINQVSVNVFGLFTAQFKESPSARATYRAYMDGHFDEVMAFFDKLVSILETLQGKKVLFVIDDLDKTSSVDIDSNVFHMQLPMLLRPRCAALYTYPLEVHHDPRFDRLNTQPNRFLLANVKLIDKPDGTVLPEGRQVLETFLQHRIPEGDIAAYLDPALLDGVFRYSCGNFRELCRILQHAFQSAAMLGRPRVDRECVDSALRQLRLDYSPFVQRFRGALQTVRNNLTSDTPQDLDPNKLAPLIQSLAVVEYPNDPGWLDIHPILKDLLDGLKSGI